MDWDSLFKYFSDFGNIIGFFSTLFGIIGFFLNSIIKKIIKVISTYKQEKILSFKIKKCCVTIPSYERRLYGYEQEVVLLKEAEFQLKLIKMLYKLKIDTSAYENLENNNINEIHIGGPIANEKTSAYLKDFFPWVKWHVLSEHKAIYNEKKLKTMYDEIIVVDENREGLFYGSNKNAFLEYAKHSKDFGVIIKLAKDDLKVNKTVHILFGGGRAGTTAAVDFFVNNYKELYKKIKKYKGKHYFIVFQVNKKVEAIDFGWGINDLTNKMFK